MNRHRRTDLASLGGELSATTSKHTVLMVTKGESSANYTVVVHLADKHGNNSLFNNTSRPSLPAGVECLMGRHIESMGEKNKDSYLKKKALKTATKKQRGQKQRTDKREDGRNEM